MPQNCLAVLAVLLVAVPAAGALARVPPPDSPAARREAEKLDRLPAIAPHGRAWIDHSGRKETGHASWYGPGFAYHRMANGERMNPHANIAASKTLPLGTTATVINLRNGKSATVKIEDRGPFVDGRVVDVSPKVAQEIGIKKVRRGAGGGEADRGAAAGRRGEAGGGGGGCQPAADPAGDAGDESAGGPAGDRDRERAVRPRGRA